MRGHTHNSRGFTLIELLVVIAIIGILSAVVLASLNTARTKGSDAAIQADLKSVRSQAELYYGDTSNSYGTQAFGTGATCYSTGAGMFSNTTIKNALAGAYVASGSVAGNIACVANVSTYAIGVKLNGTAVPSWMCIDSTGNSKVVVTSVTAFPTAAFSCP